MSKVLPLFTGLAILGMGCDGEPYTASDVQAEQASLPRDEAPHLKNSLEWWYFTGHLYTRDSSRRFGTEYVFFHTTPNENQDFLILNYALTDPQEDAFYYDVDFNRLGDYLPEKLPLELQTQDGDLSASLQGQMGDYAIQAQMEEHPVGMRLSTRPGKPILLHDGVGYEDYAGIARAGYYSFPRLETQGEIYLEGDTLEVQGTLWYDRQWDCLGVWSEKVGWDWFSVQLEDPQAELMLYQIHSTEHDTLITRAGTWFDEEGNRRELSADEVEMRPSAYWTSPETGSTYPQCWRVQIPSLDLDLEIESEVQAQEIEMSYLLAMQVHYWEGMCTARGMLGEDSVQGQSYIELTNR